MAVDDTITSVEQGFGAALEPSILERKYSSTMAKLLKQQDRHAEWAEGIYRPISLQVAPTDKCNLKCVFCSVANRLGDELNLDDVLLVLNQMRSKGIKTVEFTGGGEATLWDGLPVAVEHAKELGLGIGLITNGVELCKRLNQRYLDMFDWVRISMNCLDYVSDIDVPVFGKQAKQTKLGFSYVMNKLSKRMVIGKIFAKMARYDVSYLRVVPNCLSGKTIEDSRRMALGLGLLDHERVFWQQKKYDVPHQCRIGYLKPFLNADGYFYQCSANPLIDRRFHPDFRIGHMGEIEKIWSGKCTPFCTDNCQTGKCFFKEHNDFLDLFEMKIEHRSFV